MDTFAHNAETRPVIWLACHICRRGLRLRAQDPMIAERDAGSMFRCTVCGDRVSASYADPRGHPGVPPAAWQIEDRAPDAYNPLQPGG